ncbi:MipA/OmpV family protein [Sphingorhabdus sp. Alg239-R122]|uniref:MipA/OmpV family protein n=1 Tax=Sphingorhabdus sp. Alg239-R122 TaxID=2305989 RepID=UPI0013DA66E9|nr:MipA/OmpV family protein [Sphingorhabdus sp. Alg239-R122]
MNVSQSAGEFHLKTLLPIAAIALTAGAMPAFAQDAQAPESAEGAGRPASVFDGDYVTLGIGAGYSPSYDGSDNYNFFPAPLIQGSVDGFDFAARGPGLFVDLARDKDRAKVDIIAGPMVRARLDRNSNIEDPIVRALGEEDVGIELGGSFGLEFNQILHRFDSISVRTDVLFDVAGAHDGTVISPSISYNTPLSRAMFVILSASAEFVDDNYADTYFSITPEGNAASGLPVFEAEGGLKSIGASIIGAYDLSGNALDGGWGLFLLGNYSRLQNDAAASPVTSIRGDADQWFGAAGVSYTF